MLFRKHIILFILILLQAFLFGQVKRDTQNSEEAYKGMIKIANDHLNQRAFDSAVIYFKKSYNLVDKDLPDPDLKKTICLKQIANAFLNEGHLDSANYYINIVYNQLNNHGPENNKLQADIYYIKGRLKYKENSMDSSEHYLHKSLSYCETTNNDSLYTFILKELGNIRYSQMEYDSAKLFYKKALQVENSRIKNSQIIKSSIYQNLSIIFSEKTQYDSADIYFKKAIELKEKYLPHNDILLSYAYLNYSVFLRETGRYSQSLRYLEKVENLILSNFKSEYYLLGNMYLARSNLYFNFGQYTKSLFYLEKSKDIFLRILSINNPVFGSIQMNFGLIYYYLKKYNVSLKNLKQALRYNIQPNVQVGSLISISECYIEMGDFVNAEKNILSAIEYCSTHNFSGTNSEAKIYSCYGDLLSRKLDFENAMKMFRKSQDLKNYIYGNNSPKTIQISNRIGSLYEFENKYQDALKCYQLSLIKLNNSFNDTNIYVNPASTKVVSNRINCLTFGNKARAFYKLYKSNTLNIQDLVMSNLTGKIYLKIYEDILTNSFGDITKYKVIEDSEDLLNYSIFSNYDLYEYFRDNSYLEDLFANIELSKGSALLTNIRQSEAIKYSNISSEIVTLEEKLRSDLSYCSQKIDMLESEAKNDNIEKLKYFKNLRFSLVNKYDSLIIELEKNHPEYYSLKYDTHTTKVKDIQMLLDQESIMLNYSVIDTIIHIAIVSSDTLMVLRQNIDPDFSKIVYNYYKLIKKGGDKSEIANQSHILYNDLIKPIEEVISKKQNLIIIPDDYLNYLPFETLSKTLVSENSKIKFSEMEFLVEDFSISYNYSATIWAKSQESSDQFKFMDQNLTFAGFAPVFNQKNNSIPHNSIIYIDSTISQDNLRSITIDGKKYNELPYSKKEVETIAELFEDQNWNASSFVYENANEENFKYYAENSKIIHIATHGLTNDSNPQLSGLIFSQNEFMTDISSANAPYQHITDYDFLSQSNDGILYANEMYNLNLNANLVVLSACETGVGKLIKGEGMIAMTRGILYSGVPNIIYTLWKISDKHTHDLMIEFYRNVLDGNSYATSLRNAKLQMLKNEPTAYPKLWSGFMLIGAQHE